MSPDTLELFIAYAKKDAGFRDELTVHLGALKRQGVIRLWHDGEIAAGQERHSAIYEHLESAGIILLLVSPDFVNSDFCWDIEMKRALERHDSEEARVIPILIRPVANWDRIPIAKLQPLPRSGEAVAAWPDRDSAFVDVVEGIRTAIDELCRISEDNRDSLLADWLRGVEQDHQTLVPAFAHGAGLTLLDQVYVELSLEAQHAANRGGTYPDIDTERLAWPLEIRQLLALDRTEHQWVTGRWFLRGDPGAGKTTMLRHLAAILARDKGRPWVPLFETLPRLMREPDDWLLDRPDRRMHRAGYPTGQLGEALKRLGHEGRLLLLLDGLDEVPREKRDGAQRLVRDLAVRWSRTPIVITSRPIGGVSPSPDFVELELVPFNEERRRRFLARWFGRASGSLDEASADRYALDLEEDPDLRKLAGNPLYLTLMALLLERGTRPDRHRARLYDQIFELLYEGHYKPEPKPMPLRQATHQTLCYLAHSMTADDHDTEPVYALEASLCGRKAEKVPAIVEVRRHWRGHFRSFLEDVAEHTSILGPHEGRHADWRFWHRTFREALTAEWLQKALERDGEAAIPERVRRIEGDEGRWAEPYALLAGRIGDPDALVRELVNANRALGLRAVATVQGLREETLWEILELSDNWRERKTVYQRIPELLDDPPSALALIDRLCRLTRCGNDLYFLDQAVIEVGRRSPSREVQKATERARERLYNHIGPPPEALFRWIETPGDGRVRLWREIPEGQHWMGDPKRKREVDPSDQPWRRVSIERSFALSAVPVTRAMFAAFDPDYQAAAEQLPNHPVVGVTHHAAVSFCRWLSASVDWALGARLPTEEEWEYSCRAGTKSLYWSGSREQDLERVGWYDKNSDHQLKRVGAKPANPWDLYDMHGNVWEWTETKGKDNGRVVRGGAYWNLALKVRTAHRSSRSPDGEFEDQGFRVVLPATPE